MSGYLRRYRLEPARPHGRLLAGVLIVMALLLAKVWQSYAANSLSMERDRLRGDVRALENRIRLSSELRIQAALREGLDHESLAALGFQNPEPSAVVLIDLSQPVPRAVRDRDGVVARFGSMLQSLPGLPGHRGAAGHVRSSRAEDLRAIPVDAPIESPDVAAKPEGAH